jgi:hypothetical protein
MCDVGHMLFLRRCSEGDIRTGVTLHFGYPRRYRGRGCSERKADAQYQAFPEHVPSRGQSSRDGRNHLAVPDFVVFWL